MMSKVIATFFILCSMVVSAFAITEVSLSGTVKDGSGTAVAGAAVSLVSDTSLKATTNAGGEFSISNKTMIREGRPSAIPEQIISGVFMQENSLRFRIASPAGNGMVSLFSGNGQRIASVMLDKMEPGIHTVVVPGLSAGFHIMHITIDRATTTWKLVSSGNSILISDNITEATTDAHALRKTASASVDTLLVKKDGFGTIRQAITSYTQANIAIIMKTEPVYYYGATVENTCADCKVADLPEASSLTAKNSKLPDPFKKLDGTRIAKKSEWKCRRQEILKQAMKYIYGEKPLPPQVVTGTVTNTKITVHVEDKGKQMDFYAVVKLPTTGQAPYPAIIAIGSSSTVVTKVSSQGAAVITYDYKQVATPGKDANVNRKTDFKGLFYDMYGTNPPAGNMMAWAWGASRIIDVLQKSGGAIIDYRRLAVTGCSRDGKHAFAVGVFDERIALTIPEESSLGGMVAYRVADAKCSEKTQSNFNEQIWLGNCFEKFVMNTSLLPIDAHELIACIAPRGFYGIENSSDRPSDMANPRQMCPQGGNMATQGAVEVYKALGCSHNISYNSTPTNIGHCSYSENYSNSLTANVKKFLLHQPVDTGKIEAGFVENRTNWIDWTAPTLEDDTKLYVTE